MRARSNSAKDKPITKSQTHKSAKPPSSKKVNQSETKADTINNVNNNKTTKRDLKSIKDKNSKSKTKIQCQTPESTPKTNTNSTDVRIVKRKRTVNKTGFTKPRKRVRTESSGQQKKQNPVKTVANGKRPHSATIESVPSVCHKKAITTSNDKNCNSSQPLSRCRQSERSTSDKTTDNTINNNKLKAVKQKTGSQPVNDKVAAHSTKHKKTNNMTKKVENIDLNPIKTTINNRKPQKIERRMSKASVDSISSSEAYMSEQSTVSEAPVYLVTEPSVKQTLDTNKKILRIKSFQRNIPYKKYVKFGKYSEDSDSDKIMIASESDDKISDIQKWDTTDDSSSATKDEPKVNQKLIQFPEVDFTYIEQFLLPYDLWYQFRKNPSSNPSNHTQYTRIKTNFFCDVRPVSEFKSQTCNCEKPDDNLSNGCGHNCINRQVLVECPPTCPVGESCDNQRMQKHDWSPGLERFMTSQRGWGIRTTEPIKTGEFILEYIGEVVSDQKFKHRMAEQYQNDQHHYCLNLGKGMVIDGYRKANEGRFVNHSCEPNCVMQKWSVNGYYRVGLFALRDIEPNEELSYDYNFDNYNIETQQVCRCGSAKCRGYIGGRSQKQTNGLLLKDKSDKNETTVKELSVVKANDCHRSRRKDSNHTKSGDCFIRFKAEPQSKPSLTLIMKPLSNHMSCLVLKHSIFLLRNYKKLRRIRNKRMDDNERRLCSGSYEDQVKGKDNKTEKECFMTTLLAFNSARSVRTRGLAKAEGNEELTRAVKLAQIFFDVCDSMNKKQIELISKLESNKSKELKPNTNALIPRRKSVDKQSKGVDLSEIESQIRSGVFKSVQSFEDCFINILKLSTTSETKDNNSVNDSQFLTQLKDEFDRLLTEKKPFIEDIMSSSENNTQIVEPMAATPIHSVLSITDIIKPDSSDSLSNKSNLSSTQLFPCNEPNVTQLVDNNLVNNKPTTDTEGEEVIRCICGIVREEGEMVQCGKCDIWQHIDCVQANKEEDYWCEQCDPRPVPTEILLPADQMKLDEMNKGWKYYLTLVSDNLRIKLGDCVYLFHKDDDKHPNLKSSPKAKTRKESTENSKSDYFIIFRVQHLAINENGQKLLFGYHFLRPSETYHEPNRKFFHNEVLKSPLTEWVPIGDVKGLCCVLDLNTYCKGRPKGFNEDDVYICDMRTDKFAKSFNRISKASQFPVNTKSYAFNMFPKKLAIKRTYSPHQVPESYYKSKPKPNSKSEMQLKREITEKERLLKKKKISDLVVLTDKLMVRALNLKKENQTNTDSNEMVEKPSIKR